MKSAAVDRIVGRLLETDVALDRSTLTAAARVVAKVEDPLGGQEVVDAVVDSMLGLGPVERLLAMPGVSDVLVNGPDEIWVERYGKLELTGLSFASEAALRGAIDRAISPLGLRIDHASPAVDARLADGSRLHAAIPPIAVDGAVIAIRRFLPMFRTLADLVASGNISTCGAEVLRQSVVARKNILVCGPTGSGKTTMLNVLSAEIPDTERTVTIEDSAELDLAGHVLRLETRPANAEGVGGVGMAALVRHALRLRPDRIVIGEVRGAEALDMVQAMATGHAGSMSSVHAAGAAEALWRIELLAARDDSHLAAGSLRALVRSGLDLVVTMGRVSGDRAVVDLSAVSPASIEKLPL